MFQRHLRDGCGRSVSSASIAEFLKTGLDSEQAFVGNENGNAKQAIDSSKNPNLVFVYPEPKSELWLDSYHIPTGAKSIKAAHSWIIPS